MLGLCKELKTPDKTLSVFLLKESRGKSLGSRREEKMTEWK